MKNINFKGILFLIISLLILATGFIFSDAQIVYYIFGVLTFISLVILDVQAPKIVNLSEDNPKVKTFRFLNRLTLFIVILCCILVILSSLGKLTVPMNTDIVVITLITMVMMVFGNLSPKIPFNRYFGLRLPWTIRDEKTWRIAHRIVGYSSFPIALLMFVSAFFLNINTVVPIGILTWIIIPSIYSAIFYYKSLL
ncbi:MAG: SdpI family protein [Turicibacter sp.]|nr:SdpI family protein [Turicibacter sp.]